MTESQYFGLVTIIFTMFIMFSPPQNPLDFIIGIGFGLSYGYYLFRKSQ